MLTLSSRDELEIRSLHEQPNKIVWNLHFCQIIALSVDKDVFISADTQPRRRLNVCEVPRGEQNLFVWSPLARCTSRLLDFRPDL